MNRLSILILLGLFQSALTGCVVFPHGELVAPPAQGRVVDAETREPVVESKVTRRIGRSDQRQITFTNRRGDFAFKKAQRLGWLLMVDYGPNQIHYRFEAAGYRSFETNLYGGGSFYRGTLSHDLGIVLLQRTPAP